MNFPYYLWKSRSTKWQVVLTMMLTTVFLLLLLRSLSRSENFPVIWQNWMDPFLAISTVTIAAFIWINERRQDWENALPKKLDVYFMLGGKPFFEVKNAPLASEDDIRQWGQQIGQQMNDNERLSFNGFKVEGPNRERDSAGEHVMRHTLTVWLQSPGKMSKTWHYDDDGKLTEQIAAGTSSACES